MDEKLKVTAAQAAQDQEELRQQLLSFASRLARERGYPSLEGLNPLYLYLIETYHWLPQQVRSMSLEDLDLVLTKERTSKP